MSIPACREQATRFHGFFRRIHQVGYHQVCPALQEGHELLVHLQAHALQLGKLGPVAEMTGGQKSDLRPYAPFLLFLLEEMPDFIVTLCQWTLLFRARFRMKPGAGLLSLHRSHGDPGDEPLLEGDEDHQDRQDRDHDRRTVGPERKTELSARDLCDRDRDGLN